MGKITLKGKAKPTDLRRCKVDP